MGQTCWNYFIKNATAALFFESQYCVMRNHMHASLSPRVSQTTTDVFWRLTITRSSAVAKRPRALRVTEYFAESLEVIRNDTVE